MAGYLIRTLIGLFMYLLVMQLVPLVLAELSVGVSGNLMQIIKLCAVALVILYILFGRSPAWPGRSA